MRVFDPIEMHDTIETLQQLGLTAPHLHDDGVAASADALQQNSQPKDEIDPFNAGELKHNLSSQRR